MAAEDGPPAQHLDFLAAAAREPRRWGLFALVRGAEARARHLPRVGRARRPSQAVLDLSQVHALHFPAPTIEAVDFARPRPDVSGYWLGLTGPMGALPTHLTEFAYYERRYAKQRPFGRWLDTLANRMLQLFYRAWGDSQPTVWADRPDDDRFAAYLAMLTGATEGVGDRAAFPARARLHYASLFASRRSAVGIEDALTHLLRQPVRVREYQPAWRDIAAEDQTRLGRSYATLGKDIMAGRRVRMASDKFRVVVRAGSLAEFEALMPSGPRFAVAAEAIDAFAPKHLEWDLTVEIAEGHTRPARLDGRTRLGWTGWMGRAGDGARIRTDAHLRKRAPGRRATNGGLA